GFAACDEHVRTLVDRNGKAHPDASTSVSGYKPVQLETAYGVLGNTGSSLVAVVDAYASPNAAADLSAYRTQFGLGAANLTQVDENGNSISNVSGNTGWGQEE